VKYLRYLQICSINKYKIYLIDESVLFVDCQRVSFTARLFDYFDSGIMEGLQHRLQELAASRTQGRLAETPGNSMALTSQVSYERGIILLRAKSRRKITPMLTPIKLIFQVLAKRVELDGKTKVLLRWYPQDM